MLLLPCKGTSHRWLLAWPGVDRKLSVSVRIRPPFSAACPIRLSTFEVGVEVLGWVGVILNVLGVITAIMQDSTANLVSGIVGVLLYSGLIIAKRVGRSRWYLPFLIINGIYLALEIIVMLLLVILVSSHSPNAMMPRVTAVTSGGQEYQVYTGALVVGVLVGLLVSTAWTAYTHHVVSRAYKCVKRDSAVITVKV